MDRHHYLAAGLRHRAGPLLFFHLQQALAFAQLGGSGLQYAPIAALAAVVIPEVVMQQGQLITTWKDARVFAVLAGTGFYFWRKGQGQAVLGTILVGMAVYVPLHVGLRW